MSESSRGGAESSRFPEYWEGRKSYFKNYTGGAPPQTGASANKSKGSPSTISGGAAERARGASGKALYGSYARECYIATEVYGNVNHVSVDRLREFRDYTLLNSWLGKKIVEMYYSGAGKRAAEFIRTTADWVRHPIRLVLDALVRVIPNYRNTHESNFGHYQGELKLECKEFTKKASEFIENEAKKRSKTKLLVGLSGGVDSAVAAGLCAETRLETKLATVTDKKYSRLQDLEDSKKIAEHLGLEHEIIDATDMYGTISESDDFIRLHTMMGFRKALINSIAEKEERVIISSGNRTESCLGIFCSNNILGDIFPLANLYKTQVYQLAKYMGFPESIALKPSHDGIKGHLDDEAAIGISFKEFDVLAYLFKGKGFKPKKICRLLGYNPEVIEMIISLIKQNETSLEFPGLDV